MTSEAQTALPGRVVWLVWKSVRGVPEELGAIRDAEHAARMQAEEPDAASPFASARQEGRRG